MSVVWATEMPARYGPMCPCCGRTTVINRITPHPDREGNAVLCSYQCACGEKIDRKEY
jgi:hypothetical protein